MNRRAVLKLLTAAGVSSALPRELWAVARELQSEVAKNPAPRTLNPHQNATVTAIAEMIIPQTDTPGAKAARVNEFIDLILTDWYAPEEAQRFLAGLTNVDARCRELFANDFVECDAKQQSKLLTELDGDIAAELKLRRAGTHHHDEEQKPQHFFYMMKQLTLVGYCTSEAGAQVIGYEVIPTEHGGCMPVTATSTARR
jgi:glucoside 3-dehydrogenase (cytochrome c) hitch-hiker subunit